MMKSVSAPEPLLARVGALADPARLRLLALVAERELSVSELAETVQLPQSTVSRHLKALADAGWVAARGERTANLYRMLDGDLPEGARQLWRVTRAELEGWPALEHDRLRLARRLERRRDGGGFYAGVAGEWDRLRRELYGERFTAEALFALLPRDWVVADLACGSGSVAALVAPRVRRVIAVDLSPEMLAAARERLGGHRNVKLEQGALEALPIDDGACDAALLLLALTHVAEPARAVGEMARILRPGGRAVVVDLLRHDRDDFRRRLGQLRNGFAADELSSLLAGAGFGGVEVATLAPEAEAKGPALLLATGTKTLGPAARRVAAHRPAGRRAGTRTRSGAASPPAPGEKLLRAGGRFRARSSSPVRDPFSSSSFCPGAGSYAATPAPSPTFRPDVLSSF